jgi:glyoxylase-like metal-dependent hydrolase (beta-lactamase superfamily II)
MTDVHAIDLNFQGAPGSVGAFVVPSQDGLIVVDCGPASTIPALQAGLQALGHQLSDVRHLLLTHIHLDHAGAAGTLSAANPALRVYVQARGAGHLAAPERLMASAAQIYGDQMQTLWGEMRPVSPEVTTVLEGGETFEIGGVTVQAIYTPGHAVHHLAYRLGDELFVGDVGGIRLQGMQAPRAPTPPPDIDLAAWQGSIDTLRALDVRQLHFAHFGSHPASSAHWDTLARTLVSDAEVIRAGLERGETQGDLLSAYETVLLGDLRAEGGEALARRYATACPPWMSVQGLSRYWTRRAARGGP